MLNPFAPPPHYEKDLPELLATHKTFWDITCNTGASLLIDQVLQSAQGWEPWGIPLRMRAWPDLGILMGILPTGVLL